MIMSDGAGKPQVVIVPEQTNITSGTEVQEKLILAARVFCLISDEASLIALVICPVVLPVNFNSFLVF